MNYILIAGTGMVTYFGYYYVKNKLNTYIINKVMSKLGENMENNQSFKLIGADAALISFEHGGKSYYITTSYNRRKGRNMARKEVYLVGFDENRTNITHKQGIPYTLTANDMGGKEIIVIKDGELIKTYSGDEVPEYL